MVHILFFIAIVGLTFSMLVSGQSVVLKPEKVLLPEAYTTTIPLRESFGFSSCLLKFN